MQRVVSVRVALVAGLVVGLMAVVLELVLERNTCYSTIYCVRLYGSYGSCGGQVDYIGRLPVS